MPPSYKRNYDGGYNNNYNKRYKTSYGMTPVSSNFKNSSYKGRSKGYSKSSSGKKGPYKVLTGLTRHTNPVYPKPECKIFDCDFAGTTPPPNTPVKLPIASGGGTVCINKIPTGTEVGQFLGNQISIKSVSYRYEVDLPASPTDQVPTSGRLLLVYDKQPNGAQASFTDIFANPNYLAFANPNSRDRFVVLRNDQFSLSPQGDQTLFFERYVPINMVTTFANGSAGTVPHTGAILIVIISDQATLANQPIVSGVCRIRYYDN